MPANNKRDRVKATSPVLNKTPSLVSPGIIVKKTLGEALQEGLRDPAQFCKDFLDIEPYEKQCDFLRAVRDCSEANFVAGNRTGKTWVSGAILLWKAFYRHISPYTEPDRISPHNVYKAVSTSMTIDQAKLAWSYAHTFATSSKRFKMFLDDVVYSPFPTMRLSVPDGSGGRVPSEVWARSLAKNGLYLLGHSINFILVDECAYIKNYPTIEDEVIRMRLADTGGSLFRVSTPNGRNFFYNYYTEALKGDPRYYSYRITTLDNPYVTKDYIEQMRERMLPEYYEQNVLAEFVSLSDFFKIDFLQGLYKDVEYELPLQPKLGQRLVAGVDLGAQRDPTVITIWDISKNPWQTVFQDKLKNSSWQTVTDWVSGVLSSYPSDKTYIDATGVGAPIAQQLQDRLNNTVPFVFSAASKPDALVRLQDAIQRHKFEFPYCQATKEAVHQLSFYRLDDKHLETDFVMSMALCNLAAEDALRAENVGTQIFDDLAIVPVSTSRVGVPENAVFGERFTGLQRGTLYDFDPALGIFVPRGGEDLWGL